MKKISKSLIIYLPSCAKYTNHERLCINVFIEKGLLTGTNTKLLGFQDETSSHPISYRLFRHISLSPSREVRYFRALCGPLVFLSGSLPSSDFLFARSLCISQMDLFGNEDSVYDWNLWILSFLEQWTLLWSTKRGQI